MKKLRLTDNSDALKDINRRQAILALASKEISYIVQDVQLNLELAPSLPELGDSGYFFEIASENNVIRYWIDWTSTVGAWIEVDGRQATIVVDQCLNLDDLDLSFVRCLSSHIAATCLCLRGQVAIHANVVGFGQTAVAFAGDSGQGKSTLTAYCVSRKTGFVTDDVLVVDANGYAKPGHPRIKLLPQTVENLGLEYCQEPGYKVHYCPEHLGAVVHKTSLPLSTIYILADESDEIYSEPLSPGKAMIEVLLHSYHASVIMRRNLTLFDSYIRLIEKIKVKKLFYPRNFSRLPEVYDFLLQENNS